jgi:hypothetical protein
MTMTRSFSALWARRKTSLFALSIMAVLVMIVVLVGLGVLVVAVATGIGDAASWDRWADVGDSFGVLNGVLSGLAFAALIITLWIQFRELTLQRAELRMQRDAIEKSGNELRRSADANLRMLHFELLKMSISDPLLAKVWPHPVEDEDDDHRRQLLYANLIFQHVSLTIVIADLTDLQIAETVRYLFASPIMREYWSVSASVRKRSEVPDSDAWRIGRICDEVLRDVEAQQGGPENRAA